MQKYYLILVFFLGIVHNLFAQTVTNVRTQQENEQIIITYDLSNTAYVRVYVATGQSNQYTELKAVTGNVGKGVPLGTNRRIVWTPLKEHTEFVAPNVRFKVEAIPIVTHYFSISPTKKVAFSPGNLQYCPSTNIWRFAFHQWEYIGEANKNISKTYDGWIDLFGWGTGDNPTKSTIDKQDYQVFVDWGANTIGTDQPNTWRTLTHNEWEYLFVHTRWTMAKVNGVLGFMLLPDEFTAPTNMRVAILGDGDMSSNDLKFDESNYASNQYTAKEFAPLEAMGCIFLPCAGCRNGSLVSSNESRGYYWSATPCDSGIARILYFYSTYAYTYGRHWGRYNGYSVRLVRNLR